MRIAREALGQELTSESIGIENILGAILAIMNPCIHHPIPDERLTFKIYLGNQTVAYFEDIKELEMLIAKLQELNEMFKASLKSRNEQYRRVNELG